MRRDQTGKFPEGSGEQLDRKRNRVLGGKRPLAAAAAAHLIFLLVVASPGQAAEPWDKTDYALAGVFLSVTTIDYLQTRQNVNTKEPILLTGSGWTSDQSERYRFVETNPLLPNHPTIGQIDRAFLAGAGIVLVSAHFLPRKWRRGLLILASSVELAAAARNFSVGARIRF